MGMVIGIVAALVVLAAIVLIVVMRRRSDRSGSTGTVLAGKVGCGPAGLAARPACAYRWGPACLL
jgi:hypothetical protein